MKLEGKLDRKDYRSYVILSDGETNEGQIWEAASFAAHHKMDRLIAILDYNKFQLDDSVKSIIDMEPVVDKWKAFGWHVFEIDGHNMALVIDTLEKAKQIRGK